MAGSGSDVSKARVGPAMFRAILLAELRAHTEGLLATAMGSTPLVGFEHSAVAALKLLLIRSESAAAAVVAAAATKEAAAARQEDAAGADACDPPPAATGLLNPTPLNLEWGGAQTNFSPRANDKVHATTSAAALIASG